MNNFDNKKFHSVIYTYKRNYKKLRILYAVLFTFIATFFLLKFFKKGELKLSMSTLRYINDSMDRILKYKSREKQNEAFKNLLDEPNLEPIRMTLTTAVFKYIGYETPVILKRVIFNPLNNLREDIMCLSLRSPYICRIIKANKTRRYLDDDRGEQMIFWLLFEYLDVKITHREVGRNETIIRAILKDALEGLKYMHSKSIAHLDIKIGNIMGKTDKNGNITYKLIDFGYSQTMPIDTGYLYIEKKNFGTYPYKAPEVVLRSEHGLKSDIWSLGAVCWFLSLPRMPFYHSDGYTKDLESYRRFLKEKTDDPETRRNHQFVFDRNTSYELQDFVKKCMMIDPNQRPTAAELLEHPFIKGEKIMVNNKVNDDYIQDTSTHTTEYTTGYETYE